MITVLEFWHLKPGLEKDALALMQQMDDMLGPNAHVHPGWCGHARFFQKSELPGEVIMMYPWRSRELHEDLCVQERPVLQGFYEQYCTAPRDIHYFEELMVDVEQGEILTAQAQ
jgi:hypothetical protein